MEFELSELNIVLSVLGAFILLSSLISVKVKHVWSLGQALPAITIGIILGPAAANLVSPDRWGSAEPGQQAQITTGVIRVMIGVQLVLAGYQLPHKYVWSRLRELSICVVPVKALMWISTTFCILSTIPNLTLLSTFIIAACVTSTDPVLSQSIAKGPFADKYVARPLREMISGEAGASDGFGMPFLMLAVYLMRHAEVTGETREDGGSAKETPELSDLIISQGGTPGRLGGGLGDVMKDWFLETWLYTVLLGVAYGAIVGFVSCKLVGFCLKRKWIDYESYLLFPTALGLFMVGTCGLVGTDDPLACFIAGCALNWDGAYLDETDRRHDDVSGSVDALLNFGGFMYIGTIIPWQNFQDPTGTGITVPRLVGLGFLVLFFRRVPALFLTYKLMSRVVTTWKEALFMGYFGPIGCGAIYYLEFARQLFPKFGDGDTEQDGLVASVGPVVIWLVVFSILVHGLSIPLLALSYQLSGVKPIETDPVEIRRGSVRLFVASDPVVHDPDTIIQYNRFQRPPVSNPTTLPADAVAPDKTAHVEPV